MTSVCDHAALHARLHPDRLAVHELASDRRWTYAQLDSAIARLALHLSHEAEGRTGERIAALSKNRAELVLLHLACARAGLIFVPLNWRLATAELKALLQDCTPLRLYGDEQLAAHELSGIEIGGLLTEPEPAGVVLPAQDADRPSLMLYTSGTSGRPKGVLLSERNLGQTAINFGLLGEVTPRSAFLVDSPMFHIIGMVTSVRPPLMSGGTICISDGFIPARTLERLGDPALRISHYFCVPQMAQALRREPGFDPERLRGLAAIFTGGAPHPADDIRAWLSVGVPIVDGFGMSEAGTVFGMPLDLALIEAHAGCVGLGAPGVKARIVDAHGHDCPAGTAGELWLKGENIFSHYWNRLEDTQKAFAPDGWFMTGDIAICDEAGYFRLVDRKKDMFISGGENVYPAEIEAALTACPGIAEVAVVGMPDERWGEVGLCAYVPAPGADVDEAQLLAWLEARLARYKLPRRFEALDALPRTGSGKVLKHELVKRFS